MRPLLALVIVCLVPAAASADSAATLASCLEAGGFDAPAEFKALVGIIQPETVQTAAPPVTAPSTPAIAWHDWQGTSADRDNWWPASTVKLYAAIAALEETRRLGFSPRVSVTFHDPVQDEDGTEGATRPIRARVTALVRQALVASHNLAFDRLVEIVGFDRMNRSFFSEQNGLSGTVFLRAYGGRNRHPETGFSVNRHSPRITLAHRGVRRSLPARDGRGRFSCPDQGNCTTLRQLAEAMRRVMLHEQIPESEQFSLGPEELTLLRETLEAERREHGQKLVDAIREGYGSPALRVFHKPGYAYRWSSDVMFLTDEENDRSFLVAAAAHPGRRVLDPGLRAIGQVLGSGCLEGTATASLNDAH